MSFSTVARLVAVGALALSASPSPASIVRFQGKARDYDGRLLYEELHWNRFEDDGRIRSARTEYRDADGKLIAELVSEFRHGNSLPDTAYRDLRNGAEDGGRVLPDGIQVYRRSRRDAAGKEAEVEQKFLPRKDEMVLGQGFHHSLRPLLGKIDAGNLVHFSIILPVRFDSFLLRVRKIAREGRTLRMALESDLWFVRRFVPAIELAYDVETRNLLSYRGRSNLESPDGQPLDVVITYEY
jgi:hypothetical protein